MTARLHTFLVCGRLWALAQVDDTLNIFELCPSLLARNEAVDACSAPQIKHHLKRLVVGGWGVGVGW